MAFRLLFLVLVVIAVPAAVSAADGIQIPEPSNLALMGLGLTGLIIGRYSARSKRPREETSSKD